MILQRCWRVLQTLKGKDIFQRVHDTGTINNGVWACGTQDLMLLAFITIHAFAPSCSCCHDGRRELCVKFKYKIERQVIEEAVTEETLFTHYWLQKKVGWNFSPTPRSSTKQISIQIANAIPPSSQQVDASWRHVLYEKKCLEEIFFSASSRKFLLP